MSRQGLRSTRNEKKTMIEEPEFNSPGPEELDVTLTEMPRKSSSSMRPGGDEIDASHGSLEMMRITFIRFCVNRYSWWNKSRDSRFTELSSEA